MDLDALKTDLDVAFSTLPPEVLGELSRLVLTHKEVFAAKLPAVMEGLMPHIKAGMMEAAMGILELKDVEDAVMEVLARHGVKPVTQVRCLAERVIDGFDRRCTLPVGHDGAHTQDKVTWWTNDSPNAVNGNVARP
jgi:hypothetical protein